MGTEENQSAYFVKHNFERDGYDVVRRYDDSCVTRFSSYMEAVDTSHRLNEAARSHRWWPTERALKP